MNSRRTFLAGLGAAALAPHALPNVLPDLTNAPPCGDLYVVGVTSNPLLPGAAGELELKTWLSIDANGTGFGILTDRYGPGSGSHLAVQSATRQGNDYTWQGVVSRSNDPALLGQPFVMSATVHGGVASLELVLLGQTFSGRGSITN